MATKPQSGSMDCPTLLTHVPTVCLQVDANVSGRFVIYRNDEDIRCGYDTFVADCNDGRRMLPKDSIVVYISSTIGTIHDIAPGVASTAPGGQSFLDILANWREQFPWKTGAVIKFHANRGDKIIFFDKMSNKKE